MSYRREDVLAAVRNAFAASREKAILALLDLYGTETHEHERERVQLAILKLAAGDEAKLLHYVDAAKLDYRDVLWWSETPPAGTAAATLLDVLRADWGWTLPDPQRVLSINAFGHVLVECGDRTVWRITPEYLNAEQAAGSAANLDALRTDPEFQADIAAVQQWATAAEAALGPLAPGQCYGFKIWPALGGDFSTENLVIKSLLDWVGASGSVANQIKDLPEGTPVKIEND